MKCMACDKELDAELSFRALDSKGLSRKYRYCPHCGFAWLDALLSEDEISTYYASDYYGDGEAKFMPWIERWIDRFRRRRAKQVLRDHSPSGNPGRILDIGCGSGRFLESCRWLGFEIHGVELPGPPLDRARRIPDICVHKGPFEAWDAVENDFDIITLWHVLEHMSDPVSVLMKCRALLRTEGSIFIEVPNGDSWQGKALRGHWFHLDPPRHTVQFTRSAISFMLEKTGFKVESIKASPKEMGLYGWLQSILNRWIHPRDLLYNLLKRQVRIRSYPFQSFISLFLAVALMPLLLLVNWVESISGRGAVLVVAARKIERGYL